MKKKSSNDDVQAVAERFVILRKHLGLSQRDFAKKIGAHQPGLHRIEKGFGMSLQLAIDLCIKFNVSIRWLALGKGDMMWTDDLKELADLKKQIVQLNKTLADKEEIIELMRATRKKQLV